MRKIVLLVVLVLTAACATTPTNDFDVQVAQNDHDDVLVPNEHVVGPGVHGGLGLDVTVSNRTATPWKVEGVAISTVTPALYDLPRFATRWDETLDPGETKTLHKHWSARAKVGFGKRDIPLRVELYLVAPDGRRRTESFVR